MNTLKNGLTAAGYDALESRFALRLTARLSENALTIGPDINERLRIGREQALERARQVRIAQGAQSRSAITAAGALILGGGWWVKLGSALPLVLLLAGLLLIQQSHQDEQVSVAAEIDVALLADNVPPTAYSDPGFVEYLKTPRD